MNSKIAVVHQAQACVMCLPLRNVPLCSCFMLLVPLNLRRRRPALGISHSVSCLCPVAKPIQMCLVPTPLYLPVYTSLHKERYIWVKVSQDTLYSNRCTTRAPSNLLEIYNSAPALALQSRQEEERPRLWNMHSVRALGQVHGHRPCSTHRGDVPLAPTRDAYTTPCLDNFRQYSGNCPIIAVHMPVSPST